MNRKFSVSLIVAMLICTGFGMISSDSAQAAFVQPLSDTGLMSSFTARDSVWNEAGTMAVVVGSDATANNAYCYYPNNDTYVPVPSNGFPNQNLYSVDYFKEPIYDWPKVLLVDADWNEENLIGFYSNVLGGCQAYYDVWDVWDNPGVDQDKPTASDMEDYDLVIWIPSRYMDGFGGIGGDGLNSADILEITSYMDGGGNFFMANLAASDFLSYGTGTFPYNYLGLDYPSIYNSGYEYYVRPYTGDAVFGDMGELYQDWWSYGWSGYPFGTDVFVPSYGTICIQGRDSVSGWANTGIRYDSGTHKAVYLGFPLESLYAEDAATLMQYALDWFCPSIPVGLDQSNEYMGSSQFIDVGDGMYTDNPWAQAFVPDDDWISSVEFYMYQASDQGESFDITIYNDAGGVPDYMGIVLTSGTIYSADIPISESNADWVQCPFSGGGASLTPGNTYWIVCYRPNFLTSQRWLVDNLLTYTDGVAGDYNGISWNLLSFDFLFRTHSQSAESNTITLWPTKDNTIYSEYPIFSNGAGEYIVAGTNYYPNPRRGLLEFDIAGNIPKHSTINSVDLNLYCTGYEYDSMNYQVGLYPLWDEWGEAGTDGLGIEENGAPAVAGDATWDYSYYSSNAWMPGGDYGPSVAYSWVSSMNSWYSFSSGDLKSNIQQWLDEPSTNHGWLLMGDEGPSYTAKWFASKDSADPLFYPKLTITYIEPTIIGYRDVFWIAGDTNGMTPPATAYKLVPSEGLALIPMNDATTGEYSAVSIDDSGNPLFATMSSAYMYYYDGENWNYIPDNFGVLSAYGFYSMDFNPNDGRFYITGNDCVFYTDTVPLMNGQSKCYKFNLPSIGNLNAIAWNEYYDYGLIGSTNGVTLKLWPFGEYGNGTARWQYIDQGNNRRVLGISWDTDGWNEAGLVGYNGVPNCAYWRYYHTNPQLINGWTGPGGSYGTCAFKPPSSPKWLLIPSGAGSIRINAEEKDESSDLLVSANFPHIFTTGMWKQSDVTHIPMFETQVEADSTYTFFFEANYSLGGADQWDTNLGIYLEGWFDFGNIGALSLPGDATWSMNMYRTRQFNISYFPATMTATMNYPAAVGGVQEFAIHSVWEDPVNYGADLSHYRIYVNVTFGPQTDMAPGDGAWNSGNSWDRNSLNDPQTWDFKVLAYDLGLPAACNNSYGEYGVQRYASLLVSGNPSGSIPPGSSAILAAPTLVTYSSNMPYQLNVSIPNLYLNGDTGSAYFIPANFVSVMNEQGDGDAFNSDIWDWTAFSNPNDAWCVWGLESGTFLSMPGHGTVTAGPYYTDYSAALLTLPFEPTPVRWQVVVPAGTAEGVYRGTITITLWSY